MSQREAEYTLFSVTREDLFAIAKLTSLELTTSWHEHAFVEELQLPHALIWGAKFCSYAPEKSEDILGFIHFWHIENEVQLLNLVTVPFARRRGIARFLMNKLMAYAYTQNVSQITLEVRSCNIAAISLYTSLDFTIVRRRIQYYSDGQDAFELMRTT